VRANEDNQGLPDGQTAEEQMVAANIPQQVSNLSKFAILNRVGISALAQANSAQQSILRLSLLR
jgi:flagellin-like hook-associated protein FlgL